VFDGGPANYLSEIKHGIHGENGQTGEQEIVA
jgi:hypothetical protein